MKIQINDNTPKQIQRIMDLDQLLNKWVCGTLELDKQQRDKIETERNGLLMALAEQVEQAIFFADKPIPKTTQKPQRATSTSLKTLLDDF